MKNKNLIIGFIQWLTTRNSNLTIIVRRLILVFFDLFSIIFALVINEWLISNYSEFDFNYLLKSFLFLSIFSLFVFTYTGLYSNLIKYVGSKVFYRQLFRTIIIILLFFSNQILFFRDEKIFSFKSLIIIYIIMTFL